MALTLEGSLLERDFPAIVKCVYADAWTGTVTVTHMGVCRNVAVQRGRLVFASSSSRDDRLGDVLLRQGKITLRQYVEAGKALGGGKRLGTILVERGAITPKDLVNGVVEQTREIIFGIFQWTEGRYRLRPGDIGSEAITLKISTPELILEGIRRIEAWSRIERAVGGLEARYRPTQTPLDALERLGLPSEKMQLLAGSEERTVDEICTGSTLSHFEVCRTLWAFQVIGIIQRMDPPAEVQETEDEGLGSVLAQE